MMRKLQEAKKIIAHIIITEGQPSAIDIPTLMRLLYIVIIGMLDTHTLHAWLIIVEFPSMFTDALNSNQ